jgi:hypothetical protein
MTYSRTQGRKYRAMARLREAHYAEYLTYLEDECKADGEPEWQPAPTGAPRQQTCFEGHPLSGPNLYTRPDGRRECRACKRRRKKEGGA